MASHSFSQALLPEFDQEMKTTRAVIARVPSDNPDWKPHPKSFSLAHLAMLLASMPGWIDSTTRLTELDLGAGEGAGYTNESTEALLALFDKNVAAARAALEAASDDDMDVPWSLKVRGHVVMTMPRRVVVRQHMMHLSHHRGQMSVYLRLLDVPVPSIYGPTADEGWGR
jgi:uncharacterized damage-inducible protein DinB